MRRLATKFPILLFIATSTACQAPEETEPPPVMEVAPLETQAGSVARFRAGAVVGTIPCADCPALEARIRFDDDGTYRRRQVPTDSDRAVEPQFDLGRWAETSGSRLVLRSTEGDVSRFAVVDSLEIRWLGAQSENASVQPGHTLIVDSDPPFVFGLSQITGMYTYFADAAIFEPCGTGTVIPVAMAAAHRELESAYLTHRPDRGSPLQVRLTASLESQPIGEGDALIESVVVREVIEIKPGESCIDLGPLHDREWEVIEAAGVPPSGDQPARATMTFRPADLELRSACGSIIADLDLVGDSLQIGSFRYDASQCADALTELLTSVLPTVDRYQRFGDTVELFSGDLQVAVLKEIQE